MYPDFRILIVDDFALIRTMVRSSLNELGFSNMDEASDGVEAMAKLEAALAEDKPYAVVFLDWNMPRMTGIEVIEKCKARHDLNQLPMVMISAEREQDSIVRALEAGAVDFITKPFSTDTLQQKLQRILLDGSPDEADGDQG